MLKKTGKFKLIIALVAIMGIASLSAGLFLFNGRKARFNADGYCLQMTNTELSTTVSQLQFAAETQYASSFPASYSFKDISGTRQKVKELSYIHYADGSISAFKSGIVVNMQEVAAGYLEFYTLDAGMVMSKTASGWKIDANGHDIDFNEMLWELSENVVLLTGVKLQTVMAGNEAVDVKDYLEIRWLEDNIVQCMTADRGWQVVTPNSFVVFESGARFDLNRKVAENAAGESMLSVEDLSADMPDAIPLTSTSYLDWKIPQFNIVGEDGKTGESGDEGEIGTQGINGETGKTSSSGKEGESGFDGAPGGNGGPRDTTLGNDGDRLARITVGTVNVSNPTSVSFTLSIEDELQTLANTGGVIEIRDSRTGFLAWSSPANLSGVGGSYTVPVTVSNLEPDHSYTIYVKHDYEAEMNGIITNGNKIFTRRNFTTSSEGLSIDVSEITQNTMKVTLKKTSVFDASEVALRIWDGDYFIDYPYEDSGLTALDPFTPAGVLEIEGIQVGNMFKAKYPEANVDFSSNQKYTIEVVREPVMTSDGNGNDFVAGTSCKAQATVTMMKKIPVLGDLTIKEVSATEGKYIFHNNVVSDPDHALKSFTFTVVNGDGILVDRITTDTDVLNWYYGKELDPEVYTVSCIAEYNDNEKSVSITGGTNSILNAGKDAKSAVTFEAYNKKSSMFIDYFSNNIMSTESYGWYCSTCAKYYAECELDWEQLNTSGTKKYLCPLDGAVVKQRKETVDAVSRDKIRGDLILSFDQASRIIDKTQPITIQVKCLEDDAFVREWTETLSARNGNTDTKKYYVFLNLIDLKPGSNYVISVYATVKTSVSNAADDWTQTSYGFIGSTTVKTLD